MDSIDPEVLDFWIAFYRVEPFGDRYVQSAMIAREIAEMRQVFLTFKTGEPQPIPTLREFLPGDAASSRSSSKRRLSVDESRQQMAAIAGYRGPA